MRLRNAMALQPQAPQANRNAQLAQPSVPVEADARAPPAIKVAAQRSSSLDAGMDRKKEATERPSSATDSASSVRAKFSMAEIVQPLRQGRTTKRNPESIARSG